MRELLRTQISERDLRGCCEGTSPTYDSLLDAASEKLSQCVSEEVEQLTADVKSEGENRFRIDGELKTPHGNKTLYVELVWLPATNSFRGKARTRDVAPEPKPKSIDEFISAINAIVDEEETTFEGQIYLATLGLDDSSKGLIRSYPTIFSLFERFPMEDFGSPGTFVHIMEQHGGYEDELKESLRRTPSVPCVTLVNRLLNGGPKPDHRNPWLQLLRDVSTAENADEVVREQAQEFLEYQQSRE